MITNVPDDEPITLYRGDDFSYLFQALDEVGDPIDLSDKTILAQIRKLRTSAVVVRSFTPYIEDLVLAHFSIVLWAPDTAGIPCGETVSHTESQYHVDVRILWPEGPTQRVRTLHKGALYVSADVSRSASP
jgi:hypothetical protein